MLLGKFYKFETLKGLFLLPFLQNVYKKLKINIKMFMKNVFMKTKYQHKLRKRSLSVIF